MLQLFQNVSIHFYISTHTSRVETEGGDWGVAPQFVHSRGVAIFFPKNIDLELCEKITLNDGRLLIAKVKFNSMIYTLCN